MSTPHEPPTGWTIADDDHLERRFAFDSYTDGIRFVRRVADAAEEADHHPTMIVRYRSVTVRLRTHDDDAITALDHRMALRCNRLYRAGATLLLAVEPFADVQTLVQQAAVWAARLDLRVDLATVLDDRASADPFGGGEAVIAAADRAIANQRAAHVWLAEQLDQVPADVRGDTHLLVSTDAVTTLRQAAAGHQVLALGSHHRRGVDRILLGSVSEELSQSCPVPVLVLPNEAPVLGEYVRVHLPIDPEAPDHAAIAWARQHLADAELTAVYLLPWAQTFGPMQPESKVALSQADAKLQKALDAGGYGELERLVVVREEGNRGDALAAAAEDVHVDLLALSTRGRSGLMRVLLGSVSERVVRASTCAVLIVPRR